MTNRGTTRGFQLANIDVGLLADPKFLKLVALIPDEGERACATLVYLQTVLRSWQEGRRLSADEAEGLWAITVERIDSLVTARLLDEDHRVRESAWERFYVPALERSERKRRAGKKGGEASAKVRKQRSGNASAQPQRRSTSGAAKPNLTPADPPSPRGEAGGGQVGQRLKGAPNRPPVRMDRLSEAETSAIEIMLDGLSERDARHRKLKAELANRRDATPSPVENTDLDGLAEVAFAGLAEAAPTVMPGGSKADRDA